MKQWKLKKNKTTSKAEKNRCKDLGCNPFEFAGKKRCVHCGCLVG